MVRQNIPNYSMKNNNLSEYLSYVGDKVHSLDDFDMLGFGLDNSFFDIVELSKTVNKFGRFLWSLLRWTGFLRIPQSLHLSTLHGIICRQMPAGRQMLWVFGYNTSAGAGNVSSSSE